jgi:NAD(P)-dependent dehydrogenase (short-subunit alcohol dehydrogenase family)
MGYFSDRRVFLAGGSEGIGRSTAVELARQGAHVVVGARRAGPLEETVALLNEVAPKGRHGSVAVDVTDREAVRAAVDAVNGQLGGPCDVVITNVGMAITGYVHELDDAAFDRMIGVNYLGHANVVRAFLPGMMQAGKGDICFVSSALGFMSTSGYSAYSGSKYAVAGFAESLRMELKPHGIRVTVFYPGTTATPGLDKENEGKPAAVWAMESDSSFSKIHQPDDVAKTLIKSMERGRFENFPGLDVWFIWWMYRHFPGLSRYIADMEWAAAQKKVADQEPSASA